MKKILVLGASLYYKEVFKNLRKLGFYTISVDKDKNAPGKFFSDEFYNIDITNIEKIKSITLKKNVDALMNLNEFGALTAAEISNDLGLTGYSLDTCQATIDKGIMREKWKKKKLNNLHFNVIKSKCQLIDSIKKIGFPFIVKPTISGGAGRGVSVVRNYDEIDWAFEFAKQYSSNNCLIIESFIDGLELTVETFSIEQEVFFLAISDKVKPNIRTRVATSLNYPANISEETEILVKDLVKKALDALGINNGLAHTEIILSRQGIPYLIETGARGGGGHIFHTIIDIVSGVNAVELQANWLTKKKNEIKKIDKKGSCYRFFTPQKGMLTDIKNLEKAKKINGVVDIEIMKNIGENIGELINSHSRIGYVVTKGENRNDAINIANRVEKTISILIK